MLPLQTAELQPEHAVDRLLHLDLSVELSLEVFDTGVSLPQLVFEMGRRCLSGRLVFTEMRVAELTLGKLNAGPNGFSELEFGLILCVEVSFSLFASDLEEGVGDGRPSRHMLHVLVMIALIFFEKVVVHIFLMMVGPLFFVGVPVKQEAGEVVARVHLNLNINYFTKDRSNPQTHQ